LGELLTFKEQFPWRKRPPLKELFPWGKKKGREFADMNIETSKLETVTKNLERQSKKKKYNLQRNQKKLAAIFMAPWVIGFLAFSLYPIIATGYYGFTEFNLFDAPRWIGLDNFKEMIHDSEFYTSLFNTFYYVIFGVGLQLFAALITALLLNMKVKGRPFYRAVYFLPSIMPPVAGALLWVWLLNPKYGLVNAVLGFFHLGQPLWLSSAEWAKPAIILMSLWGVGSTMLIYLAGLGDIPSGYYEAVEIDGGGMLSKFKHVTWPLLTPITLFQIISGVIAGFNVFTQSFVISSAGTGNAPLGGIKNSLLFYAVNIYQQAFSYLKFGYASALSWVMLIIILIVTMLILKSSKKWVYYEGE
jgi:multiple sugar transport system permease protein